MSETRWTVGSVTIERVPYFDIGLEPESLGLAGVAESVDWAGPWLVDGQPSVGQAFWILRSGDQVIVVDPCGASDAFLRCGADAVGHQEAAFAALAAAGCSAESVTDLVLTHLDGIGMAALADGGDAGSETWRPAFPNAPLTIPEREYQYIVDTENAAGGKKAGTADAEPTGSNAEQILGGRAFLQLDALGVVNPVALPAKLGAGISFCHTGGHSPGHGIIEIESDGARAVMVGHLALSPLHAATGHRQDLLHDNTEAGWHALAAILDDALAHDILVIGPLFPAPGAARVVRNDPFEMVPAAGD